MYLHAVAHAAIVPERPAARRVLLRLVVDVEHDVGVPPEMVGEGSPEGQAPVGRHGLQEAVAVELPLEVQHHDQAAGFGVTHFGGHGGQERLVDVTGDADQVRLTDLEADRVRAPVVRRGANVRLVLGHKAGVAGVGQPHDADAVGDVPPGGAVDHRTADVERPALVMAGRSLGTRSRSDHAKRHRNGDNHGGDGGRDAATSHLIPPAGKSRPERRYLRAISSPQAAG